jgi:hypothetical protein
VILDSFDLESAGFELSSWDASLESPVFVVPCSAVRGEDETCDPEDGAEFAPVKWAAGIKTQSQTPAAIRYFRRAESIA